MCVTEWRNHGEPAVLGRKKVGVAAEKQEVSAVIRVMNRLQRDRFRVSTDWMITG